VAPVLEALAAEIERSLNSKGTGLITIPGLVKIEKKTVPACPTWPAYVEVTVVPELLPGSDGHCVRGLHTYCKSPATNRRGHPVCGSCGKDEIGWARLHKRGILYEMSKGKRQPYNDGWQTTDKVGKMNIIHYGQHATATCCRKCIEVWHGIPRGRELAQAEEDYLVELLLTYIRFRLPELGEE
jgi:hypothetical protein